MTTAIDYPASLPPPDVATYEIDDKPPVRRTDMDDGHARQRVTGTATPTEIPVQWTFKQWEWMLFEAWWRHKVNYVSYFNITLLGGIGMVAHEARFKAPDGFPKAPLRSGNRFIVSAMLEVRERPMLSEADFDLLVGEDGDALFAALGALHALVWTNIANI
jgi:hypothetical protein